MRSLGSLSTIFLCYLCLSITDLRAQEFELLSGWPAFDGHVRAMALDEAAGVLYVGGTFTTVNGIPRSRLAAMDSNTGALLPWDPGADSTVHALEVHGGRVYVGGDFVTLAGSPRQRLGAFDTATGDLLPWAPGVDKTVRVILPNDQVVYVGGWFDQVNGQLRQKLAAFTADGGVLLPWTPTPNGPIFSLLQVGDSIIVGGTFTTFNGQPRGYLARVDAVQGALSPWAPIANNFVSSLALQSDTLILAGGGFTTLNGEPRTALAGIGMISGIAYGTSPSITGSVQCMLTTADHVFTGGFMTMVEGYSSRFFASFEKSTLAFDPGSPSPSFTVHTMYLTADRLYLGGAFTDVGGAPRSRFATFSYCTPTTWYADNDEDGLGDSNVLLEACDQPEGHVANALDCDDGDPGIGTAPTWYLDADGDGAGDPATSIAACEQPEGHVANNFDCDDSDNTILPGQACDDGDPYTTQDVSLAYPNCGCAGEQITIAAKLFLEGAYDPMSGLMHDHLRVAGLIPLTEPYSARGLDLSGSPHQGGETISPAVLDVTGADAIVDWVVLELRTENDRTALAAIRLALVQRDGDIVDVDGVSPVRFAMPPGTYHVAVTHRNHMGVVEMDPAQLDASVRDLTSPSLATAYVADRKEVAGVMLLRRGDASFNDVVKYTGADNDRDHILQRIGGIIPTNSVSGYYDEDINMDGVVKYTGQANDRDPILLAIGGLVTTNVLPHYFDRPTP